MTQTAQKPELSIHVEQAAIDRINELRASQDDEFPAQGYLRVAVVGGGCSGFQYVLQPEAQAEAGDHVFAGAVLVDEVSLHYMRGTVIGFEKDMMGASFTIDNPNARSSCGCQASFSVDPEALEHA